MNDLTRAWRRFTLGRQFKRVGKSVRFNGRFVEARGHVELGDYCKLRNNVVMRTRGRGQIIIGDYSGISYFCFLESTRMVKIGRFTGIAEFCVVRDTNHAIMGTAEHWRHTPHIAAPIVIGDACMITSRCYIGPGVAIGDGAVLAPGTVVMKDVGPFEVWSGNPARKIAHRLHGASANQLKRYEELVARYGVQRHTPEVEAELDALKDAAAEGINRAAEERDRIKAELEQAELEHGEPALAE